MTISPQKVVSITYQLRLDTVDGEFVEEVTLEEPLVFLFGAGNMLPAFEDNLEGLSTGDAFNFSLSSIDAYGELNEDAIIELPKGAFMVDGVLAEDMLVLGNIVPMRDQDGNTLRGRIISMDDSIVEMDFNHPLAGRDLFFQGEIVQIRPATREEIAHGHVHGHGGVHH
ncbi:MAG: FKBP-type peptidyl-prolyl cis-trans isomerase [Bacteroidia bacterium]|nr:FKBP-type peptidyl-prolyl cis-trans isomerase [Bacteroidia bacterium]